MASNHDKYALLLLSGGLDSTACLHFLLTREFKTNALFIDYDQPARVNEEERSKQLADYFNIPFEKITLSPTEISQAGYIPGRNLMLFSLALMKFKYKFGVVASGIHGGTGYLDCSDKFVDQVQAIYNTYTQGQIQLFAPFLKWSKKDIWTYCVQNKIPIELTYSCELGLDQPCGQCNSCNDLIRLYAGKVD